MAWRRHQARAQSRQQQGGAAAAAGGARGAAQARRAAPAAASIYSPLLLCMAGNLQLRGAAAGQPRAEHSRPDERDAARKVQALVGQLFDGGLHCRPLPRAASRAGLGGPHGVCRRARTAAGAPGLAGRERRQRQRTQQVGSGGQATPRASPLRCGNSCDIHMWNTGAGTGSSACLLAGRWRARSPLAGGGRAPPGAAGQAPRGL